DDVKFTPSSQRVRTTSSNSPRHPSASGRRRHFHHVIPVLPGDVVKFTTSSQCFRTTSSNSPHHPNVSGRRRQFHHFIPALPDDVVKFTTSSQCFRATSSISPRHPSSSGRRHRIHHIIPARSRPALLVKSAFLSIYSCRIQKTPLKLNAKNKFKGEVCINFKNALF